LKFPDQLLSPSFPSSIPILKKERRKKRKIPLLFLPSSFLGKNRRNEPRFFFNSFLEKEIERRIKSGLYYAFQKQIILRDFLLTTIFFCCTKLS
jgi:hypothetical protein